MVEEMKFEIQYKDLIDRGLNQKASNLHPQIDRLLREIIEDKVKSAFPKIRNQPWHYTNIRWSGLTEKYFIVIAPGKPVQKG